MMTCFCMLCTQSSLYITNGNIQKHTLNSLPEPFSVSSISSILEVWEGTRRRGLGNSFCKLCCLTNVGIHSFQQIPGGFCLFPPPKYHYTLFLRYIQNKTPHLKCI